MKNQQQTNKPFHKTTPGKVFLSIIGIIVLVGVAFGGLVGYYAYTLEYGDEKEKKELVNKFNQGNMSVTEGDASNKRIEQISETTTEKIIREHNPKFGQGKVTIVAFMDFQCPFCQQQYPNLREIMNKYKPAINLVFKHFPLKTIHPQAMKASLASTCTQEQGKFWSFFDRIYQQKKFGESAYLSYAQTIGLDQQRFQQCLNREKYKSRIQKDLKDGLDLEVRGTPTFIVEDKKIEGNISREKWKKIILSEIKGSNSEK